MLWRDHSRPRRWPQREPPLCGGPVLMQSQVENFSNLMAASHNHQPVPGNPACEVWERIRNLRQNSNLKHQPLSSLVRTTELSWHRLRAVHRRRPARWHRASLVPRARTQPPAQAIKGKRWPPEAPLARPLSNENNLTPSSHFSPTTSDLASDNSYLKLSQLSFPSIPSITSTQLSSEDSPIPPTLSSENILEGESFVTAGAGSHCPPPIPKTKMACESSIVKRGTRQRPSVSRVTNLQVMGVNYGPEAMRALRLCFKVDFTFSSSLSYVLHVLDTICRKKEKQKKVT